MGAGYGAAQTAWRLHRTLARWNSVLIPQFSGKEAQKTYFAPIHVAYDTVNNASLAALAPINSRSSTQIQRQNNAVHPPAEGAAQIADMLTATLMCTL
jgi:hypothetical protein